MAKCIANEGAIKKTFGEGPILNRLCVVLAAAEAEGVPLKKERRLIYREMTGRIVPEDSRVEVLEKLGEWATEQKEERDSKAAVKEVLAESQ